MSCGGRVFAALLGKPNPSPTGDRPRESSSGFTALPWTEPGSEARHPLFAIVAGEPGKSPFVGGLSGLASAARAICPFPLTTDGEGGPNGELLKLWWAELCTECECECDPFAAG